MKESLEQNTLKWTVKASEELDDMVRGYENILLSLGQDAEIKRVLRENDMDWREAYSKLYFSSSGRADEAVVQILDAEGTIRISSGVAVERYRLPQMKNWGIFRIAHESPGKAVLNSIDKSQKENQDMAFTVALEVKEEQEQLGFILADVYRSAVISCFSMNAGTQNNKMILADSHYYVMVDNYDAGREGLDGLPKELRYLPEGQGTFYIDQGKKLVAYSYSDRTQFHVISVVSADSVNHNLLLIRRIILGCCIGALVLMGLIAFHLTRSLWRPIRNQVKAMRRVREGDMDVRLTVNSDDEIGEMSGTFNEMMNHMEQLIHNIKDKEKRLRIAQMKMLQAQIQPHFIYNTLDMIKWSAKMQDMEGVSALAVKLGRLMRLTLSCDSELISVRKEVEMLKAYLDIQQRRFRSRFEVEFHISDEIWDLLIPRMILQPIVENAVIHGLEDCESGGYIRITGRQDEKYMIFTVEDNGCGMDAQQMKTLLNKSQDELHIGMENVMERAKIYGDTQCGLFIRSSPSEGTRIEIVFLKQEECYEKGGSNR